MTDLKSKRQQQRLKYIDLCAYILGYVNRKSLMNRFNIKEAWATKDLAQYQTISDGSLLYDNTLRAYKPVDWFVPVFAHQSSDAIQLLSSGSQNIICEERFSRHSCNYAIASVQPDLKKIHPVLRALFLRKKADIKYISRSSGSSVRMVAPYALIQTGCFYYVRAFDYKSAEFRSFKLNRIVESALTNREPSSDNIAALDIDWLETVSLTIIANPDQSKEAIKSIEYDFGLIDGQLNIQVKRALVPYFLMDWNIAPLDHDKLPATLFPLKLASISDSNT